MSYEIEYDEESKMIRLEDHYEICRAVWWKAGGIGFLLGTLFTFLAFTIPV